MTPTQQEPSALADRLEIACRNAEKARSKKHLKVEPFLAQIAYIVEADLPAILSALRHPTSDAALREALVETRTVLSEIPAPYSLPLWSRMLAAIKMADAALKESGHD